MLGSIVKPLAKLAIMLIAVIFGAAILTLLVHFPLRFNPWIPKSMYWGAIWLTGILFGLGMVDLVVRRSSKGLKILGPVAAAVPAATAVLSYAILPLLNPVPESFAAPVVIVLITLGALNHYRSNRKGQSLRSGRLATLSEAGLFGVSLKAQSLSPQAENRTVDVMGFCEITQCPEEYISDSIAANRRTVYEPFRNLVRGAIGSGIPIGLRLERSGSQTRIFFYTHSSSEQLLSKQMNLLQGLLAANLSKFEFSRRTEFARPFPTGSAAGAVASMSGETVAVDDERQLPDPWTVVSKQFQCMDNAIIQVFANPVPSSPFSHLKRAYKGREYRTALGESQTTVTGKSNALLVGHKEQSVTQVNLESADKAGRLYRELHRLKAEHVCSVYTNVLSLAATPDEATQNVRMLTDLLKGALVPPDSGRDFRVDVSNSPHDFDRVAQGCPAGRGTLLTPEEVACLFVIPRYDLGVKVSKRASFASGAAPIPQNVSRSNSGVSYQAPTGVAQSPTQPSTHGCVRPPVWLVDSREFIVVGNPLRENGSPIITSLVWFRPQDLDSHMFICGNTRSGKTTTAISIVAQVIKCGIVPTILVPSKPWDWRTLRYVEPRLRIFTAGNPGISPLRINIWSPPPGVLLSKWVERLVQIFCAWLPNDRVMTMHFDDIFHTMYRNCGWDVGSNIRGRPILLSDFADAVNDVCRRLEYGDEMKGNFVGALKARLKRMLRNPAIVDMYNTQSGLTIPELLSIPTIVELTVLPETDKPLLMGILTAGISEYRIANPEPRIRNLVVLEEAHYLLARPTISDEYGPSPQEEAVRAFVTMMRTAGGMGVGILLIDQLPKSLAEEAVKLPVNIIVHSMTDEDEWLPVGKHARCSDSQLAHIAGMSRGEAVVFLERNSVPMNVKVVRLEKLLKSPIPEEAVSDDTVREMMKEVFEAYPELVSAEQLPDTIVQIIQGNDGPQSIGCLAGQAVPAHEILPPLQMGFGSVFATLGSSPRFVEMSRQKLETARSGDPRALAFLLAKVSAEYCGDGRLLLSLATQLHEYTMTVLGEPLDSVVSVRILSEIRVMIKT